MDIGYFCSQEKKLLKLFLILMKKTIHISFHNQESTSLDRVIWIQLWILNKFEQKGFCKTRKQSHRSVQSGPISNGASVIRVRTKKMTGPAPPSCHPSLGPTHSSSVQGAGLTVSLAFRCQNLFSEKLISYVSTVLFKTPAFSQTLRPDKP